MHLTFRPMNYTDVDFFLSIRNHPSTRSNLHHNEEYDRNGFFRWFFTKRPQFFIIHDFEKKIDVGYIRTDKVDYVNGTIEIGLDISPAYRRQGYGREAYLKMLTELQNRGYHKVTLEVLDFNKASLNLVKQVGFQEVGKEDNSISFERVSNVSNNKNVKVICTYYNDRRALPHTSEETLKMLKFWWNIEKEIDYGCPTDILIINNMPKENEIKDVLWYEECARFIANITGEATKNGKVKCHCRQNIGISFGAFDHAFQLFKDEYDFWFFCEDDQITVKNNVMSRAIRQIRELQKNIGFVATAGVSISRTVHAHGGCGITHTNILHQVCQNNYSGVLNRGHLPFWYSLADGAHGHEDKGEIRFTNAIHKLGFSLENLDMTDYTMSWGCITPRYENRFIGHIPEMEHGDDKPIQSFHV